MRAEDYFLELAVLTQYQCILAIYDADPAGDKARRYLSSFPRIQSISPPAHDLTDYFRIGGDLTYWLSNIISKLA